jgi:L-alanine-DL-glutamate epimerase-like enolase superfamily enzyme
VRPIAAFVDQILAPRCLGWDSDDIPGLWRKLVRATYQYGPEGIVSTAIAGVDLALWDLRGRRADQPVASLLGEQRHDRLPAYASLHWLGNPEAAAGDALRALQAGFAGVKLHEADAAIVTAVRDAIGPDVPLMCDVSARLTEDECIAFAGAVAPTELTWIEEPVFPQQDHAGLARIGRRIDQRLAAGENEFSVEGFRRLIETAAVDVVQPDLVKCGGLTVAGDIGALVHASGRWLCPHNFSLGPSLGANIHWAMTEPAARWIEVPLLPEGQRFPSRWELPPMVGGHIEYPRAAGLAWES